MKVEVVHSLEEAAACMPAAFVGGGTDLMPLLKNQARDDTHLVVLKDIPEMKGIRQKGDEITIGAGEILSDLAENALVRKYFPALAQAAARTASPQIRNMGTLGGNLLQDRRCIFYNQSAMWRSTLTGCYKTGGDVCQQVPNSPVCRAIYYSDPATALLVYDAEAEYLEEGAIRRRQLKELVHRHCEANGLSCSRHLNLLLLRLILKIPPEGEISGFCKYAMRASIDFPLINFAVRLGGDGREPKIIAGAVGPEPVELEETAAVFADPAVPDDEVAECCRRELQKKAKLIKEALISPAGKRDMFALIRLLFPLRQS